MGAWVRGCERGEKLKGEPHEGGGIPQGVGEDYGGEVLREESVEESPAEAAGERCHNKHEIH